MSISQVTAHGVQLIMKIDRLEAHDRYQYFIQDQSKQIFQGADECLRGNPDSLRLQEKSHYIYIFAHPRTADDGLNKRLLWQPRLVKPKAQCNSYLFRAQSNSDILEICWLLPPYELWDQYDKGKVCESNWAAWSIDQYKHNKAALEKPFEDDWTDEQAMNLFKQCLIEAIASKRANEEVFSSEQG